MKIEGKTLVNICTHKEPTLINATKLINHSMDFKPNTTYTIIFTSDKVANKIEFSFRNRTGDGFYTEKFITTVNAGLNIIKINILPNISSIVGSTFYIAKRGEDECTLSNIVLLEGDHTDKDLNFFEGLKSVGQDVEEVSVESVNENLFDDSVLSLKLDAGVRSDHIPFKLKHKEIGYMAFNEDLSPYMNVNFAFRLCDKNKKEIQWFGFSTIETNILGKTCERFKEVEYIQFFTNGNMTDTHTISNFVIIKDNTKLCKTYIPHKSNKKSLLYYNPTTQTWEKPILREWDSIEKHDNGKYYYHKRSEEVVLNGSESWSGLTKNQNTVLSVIDSFSSKFNAMSNTNIISDRFIKLNSQIYNLDVEGVYIGRDLNLRVDTSKLSTQDVTGFKTWLQANPTTVVYQLAQEEVYECTNLDLITYNGETNLIVSSGAIQPKITLKVLSNISNVVKLLQEKVSILENKFIEGLKQVLAGDMMSLAHLLYPEDFEHETQTLEL